MSSNTGHVGGPTMDATASELRRQYARIAELEAQLSSSGFTAADMATAEARGFRDGVASVAASAGSEPVARVNDDGFIVEIGDLPIAPGQKLYLHPSPPEGMVGGWQDIATAPKSSTDGRHIDGIYLLGFCPEPDACNLQSCICIVWWEPNMKGGNGMWYGEGGYEVHPTHWKPLPEAPTTSVGSGKGE